MKSLILFFTLLLSAISTFAGNGGQYRPMLSEAEIITIYSIDDPKRLPTIEEARADLKKKKKATKDATGGTVDLKNTEVEEDAEEEVDEEPEETDESEEDDSASEDDEEEE